MTNNARKKKLLADLHYFQMQTRIDINSLKASRRKCKEIGAELRKLKKEENNARTITLDNRIHRRNRKTNNRLHNQDI
jgi:hypothetical protein